MRFLTSSIIAHATAAENATNATYDNIPMITPADVLAFAACL